jgi:hypothetical protein
MWSLSRFRLATTDGTDIHAALLGVLEKQPNLKSVVLISDGDWNLGQPPSQAATRLRMREVPVFAVPVGAETRLPDVELSSFDVPTFAVAGKPLRIPFVIDSSLPRDEVVVLEMKSTSGEILTKEVTLPAMSRYQDAIAWKPEKPGEVKLTLTIPKTPNERYPENNTQEAPLSVRKEQLKVLVIESFPRWEYRYLRNALERDPGVEVNCLLLHPGLGKVGAGRGYLDKFPKDEELTKFDVIFLGDVGTQKGQLTGEQCTALQKLVRDQAGGLVFMPGFHGFQASLQETPLADLLPVIWDAAQPRGWGSSAPGKFALTEAGMRSLLTKLEDTDEASARVWSTLPGFQWYAPALASESRQRGARHSRQRVESIRPRAAHRHEDLRRGQNPLHGHRRRVALAQRRRGQVSLPLLGPGGALDGLSAQHEQRRQDAPFLLARSPAHRRCAHAECERHERDRRTACAKARSSLKSPRRAAR